MLRGRISTRLLRKVEHGCLTTKAQNATKVIITGLSDPGHGMVVFGINLGAYKSEYPIISSASGALNCVATIVKVVHDKFSIENVSVSTIRAAGITDINAVTNGITPNYSEEAEDVGRIAPSLNAGSFANASVIDLVVNVKSNTRFGAITTYERSRSASF